VTDERVAVTERRSGVASPVRRRAWVPRSAPATAILVLAVCLLAVQLRDLLSYSQWWTDEDQTLLWFAGSGLVHLQIHSPNILGANYNTVFESLPGALLHAVGLTLRLASPLGVALMATVAWSLLALAAWRRREPLAAALALAWPVCLSVPYLLAYDQLKGVQTGDLFAAGGVAASILMRREQRRLALMVLLAGVGLVWDNASVIATAPALITAVAGDLPVLRRDLRRSLMSLCAGAVIPVGLLALNHFWYPAHPGYVVSPPVDTSLHLSVLWNHLTHPAPLFGSFAPELLRVPWVALAWVLGVPAAAIVIGAITRRLQPAVAGAVFLAVLCVVLSVADTGWNYQPSIYLTGTRFLFLMPMGVWVVSYYSIVALRRSGVRLALPQAIRDRRLLSPAATLLVLVTVASAVVAQISFRAQVDPLISFGVGSGSGVQMQDANDVLTPCEPVTELYRHYRAQILVSLDQPFAYGCAAQTGINTLFPPYDRRPWLVKAAFRRRVTRIALWGGINCGTTPLKRSIGVCTPLPLGVVLLVTPSRTVAATLALMHWAVYTPPRR
jgi:hypothetical protein